MFKQSINPPDTNSWKDDGQVIEQGHKKGTKLISFSKEYGRHLNDLGYLHKNLKVSSCIHIPIVKGNSSRLDVCCFQPFLLKKHSS